MSGTPEPNSQPDPPPASTVAEENKNVPTTHHSSAPWSLYPAREESPCQTTGACFEVRAHNGTAVAYIAYDEEIGITPLELADAALIVNSPALLLALDGLYRQFLFLFGHVSFEANSPAWKQASDVGLSVSELLTHLRKAGVF